jgi:hypothetical protein
MTFDWRGAKAQKNKAMIARSCGIAPRAMRSLRAINES